QLPKGQDPFEVLNGGNAYHATFTRVTPTTWAAIGRALNGKRVVLSRGVYDRWLAGGATADDPFRLKYGDRTEEFTPVAVIDFDDRSPLAALGTDLIGMEIDKAAAFLRPETPRINRIDLLLTERADRETARAAVAAVVGARANVRTADEQGANTQHVVGGIQIGFTMCSLGAMVVGLFLVYNSLSVTVAERRHDIGILRSIGATRGQVVFVFLAAAAVLGLVGGAVGVPLGTGMARLALSLVKDDVNGLFYTSLTDGPNTPTTGTMVSAVLAGLATAIFAAFVPAMQAASHDPADAVRRTPGRAGGGWWFAHRIVCALLVGSGVAAILLRATLPVRVGAFGGMILVLVGLLLSAPILVGLIVRLLQPLLRAVLPIEARLAADNLIRSPGRTGLVIGALGAGVAVMIQTAGVGKSNEEPVTRWLDEVIQADQFVAAGTVSSAISSMCPADPKLVADVAKIDGVESAAGIRYMRPTYNGTVLFLTAIDYETFVGPSQARGPDGLPQLDKFRAAAGKEGVLVSDNFLAKHKLKVGESVTLKGANRWVTLPILDVVKDYSWSQGTLFLDRPVYARLFDDRQIDIVHVFLNRESEQARQQAHARVEAFAESRGLTTEDRPALRKMVGELIDRVYKLVHLQQVVVGIVASLGVVTSLLISVLQRKRELGLLLAVGATPRQVILTVLYEAVLMGLFGTFLGFLIGIPLEWYVLRVVLREESGFDFALLMPWGQATAIAAGSLLVATAAGLLPALRAVKTRIPDALAYE
nr:ABC transporter permease [Fimbriiglobus sp.]